MTFFGFLVLVFTIIVMWFVFKKMGRQGWEGIIPYYNIWVLFEVLYKKGWKCLLLLIPFYNIYLAIKLYIDLAKGFNKTAGFGIGLLFLPTLFLAIIAFDNSIQFGDGSFATNTVEEIKDISGRATKSNSNEAKKAEATADALLKYKELLDAGIITQEEFDAKKKEILG